MARTDTASRVIVAPLDRVFAGLVDPEAPTALTVIAAAVRGRMRIDQRVRSMTFA